MAYTDYQIIFGRPMAGTRVESRPRLRQLRVAIQSGGRDNPLPAGCCGTFRSDHTVRGFYVGVSLGRLVAPSEGGITPLSALSLEPTAEQLSEVEQAIAALPPEVRDSPDLQPLGVYFLRTEC